MDPEAKARSIHRMNRSWWTSVQLSRELVFQSSLDNYTHRLNRRSIGWLPVHVTASFWGGQFSITGWTDDGYWRSVGLTGVRGFSRSFFPTAIFACAAYIYPHNRLSLMVGSLKSWRKCCPSKDPSPTILEVLSVISSFIIWLVVYTLSYLVATYMSLIVSLTWHMSCIAYLAI